MPLSGCVQWSSLGMNQLFKFYFEKLSWPQGGSHLNKIWVFYWILWVWICVTTTGDRIIKVIFRIMRIILRTIRVRDAHWGGVWLFAQLACAITCFAEITPAITHTLRAISTTIKFRLMWIVTYHAWSRKSLAFYLSSIKIWRLRMKAPTWFVVRQKSVKICSVISNKFGIGIWIKTFPLTRQMHLFYFISHFNCFW